MISRRGFLKKSALIGGAAIASRGFAMAAPVGNPLSPVVISRDPKLSSPGSGLDPDRLLDTLDRAMQTLFDSDDPVEPWRRIVRPGEVIGLKVNCLAGRGMSTSVELVDAVALRLAEAGIAESDMVVWDRQNSDLEEAGFRIAYKGNGVRCYGNDALGFEQDLEVYGSAASLVCKTLTRVCDGVINLPVLKDHGIAGVTIALKNMFGAVHNPNKYHLGTGDPYIADVYMLPPIAGKVRLHICDAVVAQYEGGPPHMPHWTWPFRGLIASLDPVALDRIGWGIIEEERANRGMKTLKELEREPTWIHTAADPRRRLGTDDPERIKRLEV